MNKKYKNDVAEVLLHYFTAATFPPACVKAIVDRPEPHLVFLVKIVYELQKNAMRIAAQENPDREEAIKLLLEFKELLLKIPRSEGTA